MSEASAIESLGQTVCEGEGGLGMEGEEGRTDGQRAEGHTQDIGGIQRSLQSLREAQIDELKEKSSEVKRETADSRETVEEYSVYKVSSFVLNLFR